MKKLLAFLALALPLAAQNITVQKTPHTATPADTLTDASKIIVVPSGGSVIASGTGIIRSTEGVATSVAWGNVTGTPTTLSGYGILNTLSTTAPLTGGGALSANLTVSIPASTNSVDGYLTAADHTTFAGKENVITFTAPLSRSANTVSIPVATGSVNGYLSSADWTTFNAKQPAGNYITGLTGDITAAGPGSVAATLATVNSNVGTFGSATVSPVVTVNGKGLITAISNVTITPAVGSITGLGTGVATALGVNIGTAGAFVVNGGALGTPSSGTLTNASGLPISSGVSGLGSGVATLLGGASSGTGGPAGTTSPTFVTPVLGVASATSVAHTGTAGAGFASFVSQSSTPAAPASGYVEFADSSGRRSWRRASDGFVRTWDATLTGNHVYTLQDADGTVAFISTTVPSIAGTAGQVLVNGGTAAVAGSAVTLSLPTAITGLASITGSAGLTLNGDSTGASLALGSGSGGVATFNRGITTSASNAAGASTRLSITNTSAAGYADAFWFNDGGFYGGFQVAGSTVAGTKFGINRASNTFLIANNALGIGTDSSNPITFGINGSEAARISTGLNLLIGTTTDLTSIAGGLRTSATGASVAASSTTTGQVRFHDTSGDVGIGGGNIYASGVGDFGTGIQTHAGAGVDSYVIVNGGSTANAKLLLAPGGTNAVQILSQSAATFIDLTGTTTFRSGIGGATIATLTSGGSMTTTGTISTDSSFRFTGATASPAIDASALTGNLRIVGGAGTSVSVGTANNSNLFSVTEIGVQLIGNNVSSGVSAWGTRGIVMNTALSSTYKDSSTAGSGTVASAVFSSFATPTLSATNASVTTTDAATVYIAGGPGAGTNQTITNSWGLWNAGKTKWGDQARFNTDYASNNNVLGFYAANNSTLYAALGIATAGTLATGSLAQDVVLRSQSNLILTAGGATQAINISSGDQSVVVKSPTDSTNTSSGGLQVVGGVGIQGRTYTNYIQSGGQVGGVNLYLQATGGTPRLRFDDGGTTATISLENSSNLAFSVGTGRGIAFTVNSNITGLGIDTAGRVELGASAFSKAAWGVTGSFLWVHGTTATDSSSSGTVATAVFNSLDVQTLAATNATTYTDVANLYIAGSATAGTNVTITNGWGLWNAGKTRLDGSVLTGSSITTAAPSGGTAAAWKMGQARTSTGLVVSTTTGVQLDVGGTLYTLAVLTTNP